MKPPERFPPDDPREWLNRARGNLARAKAPVPGGYLEARGESIPDTVREAEELTHYAVHARYPSFEEPVSESEYQEVIAIAGAVLRWAEERM